jgi:glycerol-3-phosphate O-acyltransferase / dihydroxyacetone phosphate acyltransferase
MLHDFLNSAYYIQFVDPLILLRVIRSEAKRRVSFLIAAKSMQRRFIGIGAQIVGAVPVARAMDSVKPMKGKIYMPDVSDETLIRGHGTDFESKEYEHVGRIVLPKVKGVAAYSDIASINGPEELRLKRPFRESFAVDMLTGRGKVIPDGMKAADLPADFEGVSFSITPKIDQSKVYDAVFNKLSSGGCVGIFPEGGSHDRTELLPLQGESLSVYITILRSIAGVALMALGTLAQNPESGLTIIPCGMNYFHAHKFRSRCVVEFGPPLIVSPEYVEQYNNPSERSVAVKALLSEIEEALRAVIVHAPDYETLMVSLCVGREDAKLYSLFRPFAGSTSRITRSYRCRILSNLIDAL